MNKVKFGLLINYISVAIMAVSGLIMTSAVRYFYDSSLLGIFNESYAWYMILSQVSVWGIHMSVLKYVPEQQSDQEKSEVLISSLVASLLISLPLLVVAEIVVGSAYNLAWRVSLLIAMLGLPFISINKILLNFLNATLDLIGYATMQMFRYILLAAGVIVLSANRIDGTYLTVVFPSVEILVCVACIIYLLFRKCRFEPPKRKWIYESVVFGAKILPSNMVLETNSKVDVVCLGFLLNDTAQIGVYSYAILFTEGLYYVYYTLRKVINPNISKSYATGKIKEYVSYVQIYLKKYYVYASSFAWVSVLVVYYVICFIFGSDEYFRGGIYIAIIGMAITLNGKSIMWGDFLSQAGYPIEESKVNLFTILSNLLSNIVLIVLFGTIGAAVGTGISYFVYSYSQKKYVIKNCGMEL